jgi:hypothetical protein
MKSGEITGAGSLLPSWSLSPQQRSDQGRSPNTAQSQVLR